MICFRELLIATGIEAVSRFVSENEQGQSDINTVSSSHHVVPGVVGLPGCLRYVKAMGIASEEQNLAQVTMNLTDYTKSSMYTVFELIKIEARRYGINVLGSEIVGIVPAQALIDSAEYYLQLSPLSPDQILDNML